MIIPDELKNALSKGDYTLIAEMYAERHRYGNDPDYNTVTSSYVSMVLNGQREANEGTAAEEIVRIATAYLEHKRNFWENFLLV
jgi:hypothetical protein